MDSAEKTRLGLLVLASSIAVGIVGDALLNTQGCGINVPLFLTLALATAATTQRSGALPLPSGIRWLALPVLALGALFAWRDAASLKVINGGAILLLVGIALLRARSGAVQRASVADYIAKAPAYLMAPIGDFCRLVFEMIEWKSMTRTGAGQKLSAVVKGLAIAVPLVAIFGALFVNADATFEGAARRILSFDAQQAQSHLLGFGFLTWIVGGILVRLYLVPAMPPKARMGNDGQPLSQPAPLSLGMTEVCIVLGALILLFGAFVATQFGHLFNNARWVHDTAGVTFSNYARRGFFELVAVAALSLPTLAGLHSLLRRENPAHEKVFRALSWVMIGLVFVVIDSAVNRMVLYVGAYGMTILRLYVCASLAWIALVTLWFGLTALRGRSDRFAWGGVMALLACVFALNVINPEGLIARVNTSRPDATKVDWAYLSGLGNDAAPALCEAMGRAPRDHVPDIAAALLELDNGRARGDWRTWSISRQSAARILSAHQAEIASLSRSATRFEATDGYGDE